MKTIIHDEFLLQNDTAKHLYHTYADKLPIIDYHCHLNPAWIAEDHRFCDLGELLLAGVRAEELYAAIECAVKNENK